MMNETTLLRIDGGSASQDEDIENSHTPRFDDIFSLSCESNSAGLLAKP